MAVRAAAPGLEGIIDRGRLGAAAASASGGSFGVWTRLVRHRGRRSLHGSDQGNMRGRMYSCRRSGSGRNPRCHVKDPATLRHCVLAFVNSLYELSPLVLRQGKSIRVRNASNAHNDYNRGYVSAFA